METLQDRLADALFSYSLSVLCDQDEAVAAVRQARRLAARHARRLRRPELERAWLYALARYVCLVRLEARPEAGGVRPPVESAAARSRLARLAWPEAAGTTPSQREALELAGRHSLENEEIAAVLGIRVEATGVLLSQGVCEVERTAAALAVLAVDACPELNRLGRGRGPVLGRALRNELVRHLDDCPTCRGTAERGAAEGPWPGTFRAAGSLPLVHLPRAALRAAGGVEDAPEPRFDRRGFPQHPARVRTRERVREREQVAVVRQRAVLGSVAAAVVAGPGVALWAVHAGGASTPAAQVTSVRVTEGASGAPGATPPGAGDPSGTAGAPPSAGVTTAGGGHLGENIGFTITSPSPSASSAPGGAAGGGSGGGTSPGQLQVQAAESGDRTVITLTNTGGGALMWTASTDAPWLRLSRDGGTLAPGAQLTVLVSVDESRAPVDPWSARIVLSPSGAVVTLSGTGTRRGAPSPSPTPTSSPTSSPTAGSPTPTPTPSGTPTPTPTPSASGSASGGPGGVSSGSPSATPVTASPSAGR